MTTIWRVAALCGAMGSSVAGLILSANPKTPPASRMTVTLHALDWRFEGLVEVVDAYVVLPDGTHAHGRCYSSFENAPCVVESTTPERRRLDACKKAGVNAQHCVYDEEYGADRRANVLTLYGANGAVAYHIVSSW